MCLLDPVPDLAGAKSDESFECEFRARTEAPVTEGFLVLYGLAIITLSCFRKPLTNLTSVFFRLAAIVHTLTSALLFRRLREKTEVQRLSKIAWKSHG